MRKDVKIPHLILLLVVELLVLGLFVLISAKKLSEEKLGPDYVDESTLPVTTEPTTGEPIKDLPLVTSPTDNLVEPTDPKPRPTPKPITGKYTCPGGGWVNCMPTIDYNNKERVNNDCSAEAQEWFTANCPDYKGVAY